MKQTFTYWLYVKTTGSEPTVYLSDIKWFNKDKGEPIGEYEVTHEVPSVRELTPAVVAQLKAERDEMRAVANAAITEMDDRIASLLALENNNEA